MFFLLLFGIIEAGRFVYYYETLSNATREGARYAIVNGAGADEVGCPTGPAAPGSNPCDINGVDVETRVRKSSIGVLGSGRHGPALLVVRRRLLRLHHPWAR